MTFCANYFIFQYLLTNPKIETKEVKLRITTQRRFFPTPITPPTLVMNVAKSTLRCVTRLSTKFSKSTYTPLLVSVLTSPRLTTLYLKKTKSILLHFICESPYLVELQGIGQSLRGDLPSIILSK